MYPILDVMTVARFGVCVYQRQQLHPASVSITK
jgi:hypothetical protein